MLNKIILFLVGFLAGAIILIPLSYVSAKIVIPLTLLIYIGIIIILFRQSGVNKFLKPINYGFITTLIVGIIAYAVIISTINKIV